MLPILYQNPDFVLYAYPLFMGLGWGIAYQLFFACLPDGFSRFLGQILFWGLFVCAWLGAKLLFYLTAPAELGQGLLLNLSFWTGGGFVFYGGLLGGVLFLLLFHLLLRPLNAGLVWALLPALTMGHGVGRIGCLLAGCCFGAPTDWFWGLHLHGADRHPTQLLEALGLLALGLYLLKSQRPKWLLILNYLWLYGGLRFGVELLRGDAIRGQWGALTPSQWISLLLILSGFAGLVCLSQFQRLPAKK
jgi:phosphatidylglycerol---prolipoprotein diacylglyceryl transferase